MTPLRQRFIDDLRIRNRAARTIDTYVGRVAQFARHFGRSPELLGTDEVRQFQVHLVNQGVSWSVFNQTVCALRFLYGTTLGRPELLPMIPFGKRPKTVMSVLAAEEVVSLIQAAVVLRDRMMIEVAYGCGLRLNELLHVRLADIDGARRVLLVRHGKGAKQRLLPLSARLLENLRGYWRLYRPSVWLFPGKRADGTLSAGNVQRSISKLVKKAGLNKRCSMHTLRHSYATHLLEAGVDLLTLKRLMGHRSLETTMRYLHVSTRPFAQTPSLLDLLVVPQAPAADTPFANTALPSGPLYVGALPMMSAEGQG